MKIVILPRRFLDTWNNSIVGKLPKTNTAQVEIPHISALPPASETTTNDARFEFRRLFGSRYN